MNRTTQMLFATLFRWRLIGKFLSNNSKQNNRTFQCLKPKLLVMCRFHLNNELPLQLQVDYNLYFCTILNQGGSTLEAYLKSTAAILNLRGWKFQQQCLNRNCRLYTIPSARFFVCLCNPLCKNVYPTKLIWTHTAGQWALREKVSERNSEKQINR